MVNHYQKPCQESDHHKNLHQKRFLEGVFFLIVVHDDWITIFNKITHNICNREVDRWEKYYISDTTQNIEGAVFTLWEEMLCLHTKWVENISVQWQRNTEFLHFTELLDMQSSEMEYCIEKDIQHPLKQMWQNESSSNLCQQYLYHSQKLVWSFYNTTQHNTEIFWPITVPSDGSPSASSLCKRSTVPLKTTTQMVWTIWK